MSAPSPVHLLEHREVTTPRLPALLGLGVLWIVAYAPALRSLIGTWSNANNDMQHGFAVPLIVLYIFWTMRTSLTAIAVEGTYWGAAVVVGGVVLSSTAILLDWPFFLSAGMLIAAVGCFVTVYGVKALRLAFYPLLLLPFMIQPPSLAYAAITGRLQMLASWFAEMALEAIGFSVLREGNVLEMSGVRWSVVEACSGIRSLVTLAFFFLVYTYLFVRDKRIAALLLVAVIPITVAANAMRVIFTVIVGRYNRELATGMMHDAAGYIIVVCAAALCIGLHQVMERMTYRRSA